MVGAGRDEGEQGGSVRCEGTRAGVGNLGSAGDSHVGLCPKHSRIALLFRARTWQVLHSSLLLPGDMGGIEASAQVMVVT